MHSLSSGEMLKHLRARRFLTAKTRLLHFGQTIGYWIAAGRSAHRYALWRETPGYIKRSPQNLGIPAGLGGCQGERPHIGAA
jgi:hypothetical protein